MQSIKVGKVRDSFCLGRSGKISGRWDLTVLNELNFKGTNRRKWGTSLVVLLPMQGAQVQWLTEQGTRSCMSQQRSHTLHLRPCMAKKKKNYLEIVCVDSKLTVPSTDQVT